MTWFEDTKLKTFLDILTEELRQVRNKNRKTMADYQINQNHIRAIPRNHNYESSFTGWRSPLMRPAMLEHLETTVRANNHSNGCQWKLWPSRMDTDSDFLSAFKLLLSHPSCWDLLSVPRATLPHCGAPGRKVMLPAGPKHEFIHRDPNLLGSFSHWGKQVNNFKRTLSIVNHSSPSFKNHNDVNHMQVVSGR